jgi:heptaprenylglyceryl phosphate synthase
VFLLTLAAQVVCIHVLATDPSLENMAAAIKELQKLQNDLDDLKGTDNMFLKAAMPVITAAANHVAIPVLPEVGGDEAILADVLARHKFAGLSCVMGLGC